MAVMFIDQLQEIIAHALQKEGLSVPAGTITLEHPSTLSLGDFATNVALIHAKDTQTNPHTFAEKIVAHINGMDIPFLSRIEVAGPGFINFFLSTTFFASKIESILENKSEYGLHNIFGGKKFMIEYTDPNPFKEFHIGHLMSNIIGEALSRLYEFAGAEVIRASYQGDMGLNVAQAIWGMKEEWKNMPLPDAPISERIRFLGASYSKGAQAYADSPEIADAIREINKKVFARSDQDINHLYDTGRSWSLEHFEEIYSILGTRFDHSYFESEVQEIGVRLVREGLARGVFTESEGAVVYRGEDDGLHTRVFLNKEGLPTYEAKELGLAERKEETEKFDTSIIVTANEQKSYMEVVLAAQRKLNPEAATKVRHITHGLMKLPSGKMSSREGNVVAATDFISRVRGLVYQKIAERTMPELRKQKIADEVAVGAIKYSILRQAIGTDIVFDFEKSISFEGDSGPYLQYSYTRARSLLSRAAEEMPRALTAGLPEGWEASPLERLLARFPEIVENAARAHAPHTIVTYLTELASAFNSFYGEEKIVGSLHAHAPYKVVLTYAFATVMQNGLYILGIPVPEAM